MAFIPSLSGPNLIYSLCSVPTSDAPGPSHLKLKQRICTDLNLPEKLADEPNKNPKDNVESCPSSVWTRK